jgi:hypothetical protein
MSESNECAYPILETQSGINFHPGLTKREAFAMAAMQGILSHSFCRGDVDELAVQSARCADALLKELSK